ncbi:MAG: histidinol-phosphate transaminase [Candidatus Hydrothermarchaeota archaeon]
MEKRLREIKDLKTYIPGKSVEELAREYKIPKDRIIKLGSNENPIGPSPLAVKSIIKNAGEISSYGDPTQLELRKKIKEYVNRNVNKEIFDETNIILGNGSDELIDFFVRIFLEKGEKVLIPIPTYPQYEITVRANKGKVTYSEMIDFKFDVNNFLSHYTSDIKLIFLCSPNNPTSGIIERKDIIKILDEVECPVFLDEAYYEYCEKTSIDLTKRYDNFFVSRTFSKIMGLAGLRLGYGISNEEMISYMTRIRPPFNVNVLVQKAAIATLEDIDYIRKSKEMVDEGREYLTKELTKLGFYVYPSHANFILVNVEKYGRSNEITERLFREGIIVRDCKEYSEGLDDRFIRITIGKKEDNEALVAALRNII